MQKVKGYGILHAGDTRGRDVLPLAALRRLTNFAVDIADQGAGMTHVWYCTSMKRFLMQNLGGIA